MTREELIDLQRRINSLREHGDDYLIIEVGAFSDELGRRDGFAVATVRMGNDRATSRAKYLDDAIALARGNIIQRREAKKKAAKEAKESAQ